MVEETREMIMDREDVHEYWKDAETDKYGASRAYHELCKPEYYVNLKSISEMWVGEFRKFVPLRAL